MKISREKFIVLLLSVLYLATHLPNLTKLPVFSDEAIYIRWAQVAFREPEKYAFLSMLDGKPPLHVWSMIPFLQFIADPLLAGRLVSILAGLGTMFVLRELVKELGGAKRDQYVSMALVATSPFWFFHHRMALAEAELVLFFSLSLLFALRIVRRPRLLNQLLFALSFGAALWIKTTALFFIPVFALVPLLFVFENNKTSLSEILHIYIGKKTLALIISGIAAGMLFFLLRLTPLFSSLFSRSADYTFTFTEILHGEWQYALFHSIPKVFSWLIWYMSPFLLFAGLLGKRRNLVLFVMALLFSAPLIFFGKVLSVRYFFPAAVPLTLMSVFGIKNLIEKQQKKKLILLGFFYIVHVIFFIELSVFQPHAIPLTPEDTKQYLTEWSSGYGIPEARDYFVQQMKEKKIIVGTEGYFGTLPDGLQIYFDRHKLSNNIEIIGVGQPIHAIPERLLKASETTETYLLVNEHRFFLNPEAQDLDFMLIARYPRPFGGPSLLLLKIEQQ